MTEEQKIKVNQVIREVDRILAFLKTVRQDVRTRFYIESLEDIKITMLGFLFDSVGDECDEIVTKQIQEDDEKLQRGESLD